MIDIERHAAQFPFFFLTYVFALLRRTCASLFVFNVVTRCAVFLIALHRETKTSGQNQRWRNYIRSIISISMIENRSAHGKYHYFRF